MDRDNPVTMSSDGIVSKDYSNDLGKGAAYVFKLQSGKWVETDELHPTDLAPYVNPPDPSVPGANDCFGQSVSIYGNTAIISADFQDEHGQTNAGAAYIYSIDPAGKGTEVQKLTASDGAGGDRFGRNVSIVGDYAVVGAYKADLDHSKDDNMGAAYVFKHDPATGLWTQIDKLTAPDAQPLDTGYKLGNTLSLFGDAAHGTYVLVGAPANEGSPKSGKAYIFVLEDPTPPPPPPGPGPDTDAAGAHADGAHATNAGPLVLFSGIAPSEYVEVPWIRSSDWDSGFPEFVSHETEQTGGRIEPTRAVESSDHNLASDAVPFFGLDVSEIPVSFAEATQASADTDLDSGTETEHSGAQEEPIGLHGFLENWSPGKFIVFNFDQLKLTEVMEDFPPEPHGSPEVTVVALNRLYDPKLLDWSPFLGLGSRG